MKLRSLVAILVLTALGACALPPPDQPAHPIRMGRFLGLVARCGCSDISGARMLADYPRAVAGCCRVVMIDGFLLVS